MARRSWCCPGCGAELGTLTNNHEHLHGDADRILRTQRVTQRIWLIQCRCGMVRSYEGRRVVLEVKAKQPEIR